MPLLAINRWDKGEYPHSVRATRNLIKRNQKELVARRVVSRLGRTIVIDTDKWRDWVLTHGDNVAGLGASHQTGWTGLVAELIQQCAEHSQS